MTKILIIDDDESLLESLFDWLTHQKYEVVLADRAEAGLKKVFSEQPNVIILDWEMPHMSGIELLASLRRAGVPTPVLMLTGKTKLDDKTEGFNSGTDDYLCKPFEPRELSARLKALLRRFKPINSELQYRDITLLPDCHTAMKGESNLNLSRKEFALLQFLMAHPQQTFSIAALMERAWHEEAQEESQAVRTCISKLRSKIEWPNDPPYIINCRSEGYRLAD
jgi:two-component system OmpR family response regulator